MRCPPTKYKKTLLLLSSPHSSANTHVQTRWGLNSNRHICGVADRTAAPTEFHSKCVQTVVFSCAYRGDGCRQNQAMRTQAWCLLRNKKSIKHATSGYEYILTTTRTLPPTTYLLDLIFCRFMPTLELKDYVRVLGLVHAHTLLEMVTCLTSKCRRLRTRFDSESPFPDELPVNAVI